MIGESEDLATSLLSDADMNHDSKIDLDGKDILVKFWYFWVTWSIFRVHIFDELDMIILNRVFRIAWCNY